MRLSTGTGNYICSIVTETRHVFCLTPEATLNWQSSEHQAVNSRSVPEGQCSHMHPPLAVMTSNNGRLFDENFLLFQWLFHLFCNWHKIARILHFFTTFSFLTTWDLSSASSLLWKLRTYHICFVTSSKLAYSHSLQLSPNSSSLSHRPGSLHAYRSLTVSIPPWLSPCSFATISQFSRDLIHFQILIVSFL